MEKKKVVVGITGASGALYARLLLEKLRALGDRVQQVGVIMSDSAKQVWEYELPGVSYEEYPFSFYEKKDFFAPFASGSAGFDTMIVCPCSMGTLGRIAQGTSDDLMTRAADVMLKERGRLILVARETPLNTIHLKNMLAITQAGGIICPAIPSFYSLPESVEQLAETVVDRVLQLAGLPQEGYRWGENS